MGKTDHIGSIDPYIPLPSGTIYYQAAGKTVWHPIEVESLEKRLASAFPPEFRTALGIVGPLPDQASTDAIARLGPWNIDIDASDIGEAITALRKLMNKFKAKDLDLSGVRFHCSGGKGFHIEIPMQCFMPFIPKGGIVDLNRIYKAMSLEIIVDGLDLNVYGGGKGHCWRIPNRLREDRGTYKVPVSLHEVATITPESYKVLVSSPREFPPLAVPTFSPELGLLFATTRNKVANKASQKRKVSGIETKLKGRFGSNLPPVLREVAQGRIPLEGGWNRACVQLAATAHALGWDEDKTVAAFSKLIQNHESDGRYNTPAKREQELREKCRYVANNPTYGFSVGGILSILPRGIRVVDFRGLEA